MSCIIDVAPSVEEFEPFAVLFRNSEQLAKRIVSNLLSRTGSTVEQKERFTPKLHERITAGLFAVNALSVIQVLNLAFVYLWSAQYALAAEESTLTVFAALLLCATPAAGLFGAWFRDRDVLKMHHMTSVLLFSSPLLWAFEAYSNGADALGLFFLANQLMLLFYQYDALNREFRLISDLKQLRFVDACVFDC